MSYEELQRVQTHRHLVKTPMPVVIGENGRRLVTIADILTLRRNPSHAGYPELRLRHRLIRFIFYHAANDSARLQADDVFLRLGLEFVFAPINDFGNVARRGNPDTQDFELPVGHGYRTMSELVRREIQM